MVRLLARSVPRGRRFPHRRGDGPYPTNVVWYCETFSPHVVGMVRWLNSVTKRASRFPHTRGDGPTTGEGKNEVVTNRDHLSIHRIGLLTGDFGAETPG